MKIESKYLPFGQPLADAYMERKDRELEALLGYHAAETEHWRRRFRRLRQSAGLRADSRRVAETLRRFQEPFGLTEQTLGNLEKLGQGAPVVVGGQQAVLWGGPLMIIHKAITILQTAEWASRLLGEPVVPVFWIAGEDHDWDEASHVCLPVREGSTASLDKQSIPRPGGGRTSVSRTTLSQEELMAALTQLEGTLPDSEHKLSLIEGLREGIAQCRTLTDLFAFMLNGMFGDRGLLLVDADDPALRRLEGPMFSKLIQHNEALERAFSASSDRVEELEYPVQAELAQDGANLFLFQPLPGPEGAEERLLLHRRGSRFEDRRGLVSYSRGELLGIAAEQPERLSNNVFTRPLMQDYVFPVLSTVLGPGEIAYWAQTGAAFRTLGMEMPIITPRLSFTLLEPQASKTMEQYGLSLEDALRVLEEKKAEWLRGNDRYGIEERFQEALTRIQEIYSPVLAMAASVEKGLSELGGKNWQRIEREIQYMEDKTKKALETREQAVLHRMDALGVAVAPEGRPQERIHGSVYYLNCYGRGWLDALLRAPYKPGESHRILWL